MKLLVTGGAGYIGSVVATMLLEQGHEVIVLDNLSRGHQDAVPDGAQFVQGEIADVAEYFSRSDQIDAVLHFAALSSVAESVTQPELYWNNNVVGSLGLLAGMRQLNIRQLIFSSTAAVYGIPKQMPITEETEAKPTNAYGRSKLTVDMAIASDCEAYGLAATSLRYFNVAGAYKQAGERHPTETHIIPLAFAALQSQKPFNLYGTDYPTEDGTCIRDYIDVGDLAMAHILALQKLSAGEHQIYNLGNGNGFSNQQVLKTVEEVTGQTLNIVEAERRLGDPPTLIASSAKAQSVLSWLPAQPELTNIVKGAWEFYQTAQP